MRADHPTYAVRTAEEWIEFSLSDEGSETSEGRELRAALDSFTSALTKFAASLPKFGDTKSGAHIPPLLRQWYLRLKASPKERDLWGVTAKAWGVSRDELLGQAMPSLSDHFAFEVDALRDFVKALKTASQTLFQSFVRLLARLKRDFDNVKFLHFVRFLAQNRDVEKLIAPPLESRPQLQAVAPNA
jgi:hypothetical protein